MISLLVWVFYGLVVGLIAKAIYRDAPTGFVATLAVGICGSFIGGLINYLALGRGEPLQPSGILMGILGGVVTCYLYRKLSK